MIDIEVIDQRLAKMRSYVRHLGTMQDRGFDAFISDAMAYSASLHWLQMAIQTAIDISRHLISENQWEMPKEMRELPGILADNGIIEEEFAARLAGMFGMRNVIAHEYLDVDLSRVYDVIQNHLDDFDEFAKHVVAYLERESIV